MSINSGTNVSTSCRNLVKIDPVSLTSEEIRLESENCAATRLQFDDRPSFGTLAFINGLEYRNVGISQLFGNHFSTSCKILVRFGSVTLELRRTNCTVSVHNFTTVSSAIAYVL